MVLLPAALSALALGDEPPGLPQVPTAGGESPYSLFAPTPISQLRDMDTDRPNITNTPHTVDAGHCQIETGVIDYTYYRERSPGTDIQSDELSIGQFNLRVGILPNLELNVEVDTYETNRAEDYSIRTASRASGPGDTVLGGKLNLWGNKEDDSAGYTALAIQPQFKFPTGRNGLGNGRFEFSVAVPFLTNLPSDFHLGLQIEASMERNSNNTGYVAGIPSSISLDRVVLGSLDVYVEYANELTSEKHVTAPQTLDLGGTYPLGKNIILDAGINIGLNRSTPNIEALAGISFRR
jgi:hypothetical protein